MQRSQLAHRFAQLSASARQPACQRRPPPIKRLRHCLRARMQRGIQGRSRCLRPQGGPFYSSFPELSNTLVGRDGPDEPLINRPFHLDLYPHKVSRYELPFPGA